MPFPPRSAAASPPKPLPKTANRSASCTVNRQYSTTTAAGVFSAATKPTNTRKTPIILPCATSATLPATIPLPVILSGRRKARHGKQTAKAVFARLKTGSRKTDFYRPIEHAGRLKPFFRRPQTPLFKTLIPRVTL